LILTLKEIIVLLPLSVQPLFFAVTQAHKERRFL